jgi:hypothetical protein
MYSLNSSALEDQLVSLDLHEELRSSINVDSKKTSDGAIQSMSHMLFRRKVIATSSPADFIKRLNAKQAGITDPSKLLQTISELVKFGLDHEIENWLLSLISSGLDQADVVIAFLYALSQTPVGDQLDRSLNRVILKAYKQSNQNQLLDDDLMKGFLMISDKVWNWQPLPLTI